MSGDEKIAYDEYRRFLSEHVPIIFDSLRQLATSLLGDQMVYVLSAPTGSGKTHQAVLAIVDLLERDRIETAQWNGSLPQRIAEYEDAFRKYQVEKAVWDECVERGECVGYGPVAPIKPELREKLQIIYSAPTYKLCRQVKAELRRRSSKLRSLIWYAFDAEVPAGNKHPGGTCANKRVAIARMARQDPRTNVCGQNVKVEVPGEVDGKPKVEYRFEPRCEFYASCPIAWQFDQDMPDVIFITHKTNGFGTSSHAKLSKRRIVVVDENPIGFLEGDYKDTSDKPSEYGVLFPLGQMKILAPKLAARIEQFYLTTTNEAALILAKDAIGWNADVEWIPEVEALLKDINNETKKEENPNFDRPTRWKVADPSEWSEQANRVKQKKAQYEREQAEQAARLALLANPADEQLAGIYHMAIRELRLGILKAMATRALHELADLLEAVKGFQRGYGNVSPYLHMVRKDGSLELRHRPRHHFSPEFLRRTINDNLTYHAPILYMSATPGDPRDIAAAFGRDRVIPVITLPPIPSPNVTVIQVFDFPSKTALRGKLHEYVPLIRYALKTATHAAGLSGEDYVLVTHQENLAFLTEALGHGEEKLRGYLGGLTGSNEFENAKVYLIVGQVKLPDEAIILGYERLHGRCVGDTESRWPDFNAGIAHRQTLMRFEKKDKRFRSLMNGKRAEGVVEFTHPIPEIERYAFMKNDQETWQNTTGRVRAGNRTSDQKAVVIIFSDQYIPETTAWAWFRRLATDVAGPMHTAGIFTEKPYMASLLFEHEWPDANNARVVKSRHKDWFKMPAFERPENWFEVVIRDKRPEKDAEIGVVYVHKMYGSEENVADLLGRRLPDTAKIVKFEREAAFPGRNVIKRK